VTTTTRTIKEVTYLGPDGQPIDYLPSHMPPMLHYDHNDYQNQVRTSQNLTPGFLLIPNLTMPPMLHYEHNDYQNQVRTSKNLTPAFWQSLT
jgi:hypothetical protein